MYNIVLTKNMYRFYVCFLIFAVCVFINTIWTLSTNTTLTGINKYCTLFNSVFYPILVYIYGFSVLKAEIVPNDYYGKQLEEFKTLIKDNEERLTKLLKRTDTSLDKLLEGITPENYGGEVLSEYNPTKSYLLSWIPSNHDDIPEELIQGVFDDLWKEIVCNPDGTVNIEQVKRELYDFWIVMDNVSKVYCDLTGGRISKITTDSDAVISEANQAFEDIYRPEIDSLEERIRELEQELLDEQLK